MEQVLKYFSPLLCIIILGTSPGFAEVVTFTKEYSYQASDFDSRNSSRTIALAIVKRLLLEELGTYLVSKTEVKNMQLTKDQVTIHSAGIVGAEVIEEKWNGKTFWLKAKVSADPKEVEKSLKKIVEDKSETQELEDTRRKAEELAKEKEDLLIELQAMSKAEKHNIKAEARNVTEYENTIKSLTAIDWFEKGYKAANARRWDMAINNFTKALELKPDFADAYYDRGLAYNYSGIYQQAINNFTKALELKSDFAYAYYGRGLSYGESGDFQQAIKDYTKAIKLKPDYVEAYNNRGVAYATSGDFQQAISNFTIAIELKADFAAAYYNRGKAYKHLGKHKQAIDDFIIAARLGDKAAQSIIRDAGIKWCAYSGV